MTTRVWHDEEAYTRRSVARPLPDVKRDLLAFHAEIRALAERYGVSDVLCATEANADIDGDVVRGFSFSHNGDNARIMPMIERVFYECVSAGVIEAEADK